MHWHTSKERGLFRAWFHWNKRSVASIEVCWRTWLCGISFEYDDERGWGISLRLPPIAFFGHLHIPRWRLDNDRITQISVHNGGIWWKIWLDPNEWSSRTPKWREGNFNFVNFLLGHQRCTEYLIEERNVLIPMPEGTYQARARLKEFSWSRPRWFTKRIKRVVFDIPKGIPHEGKGENAWDCGHDATFGFITGECISITEGVGMLVGTCLSDRVKYGGWDDYNWEHKAVV